MTTFPSAEVTRHCGQVDAVATEDVLTHRKITDHHDGPKIYH